ncbi:hypothetical protein ACF06W_11605 [Streptomyces albus]|uniref:hypothetical protein n=1 Tax=Streptomyces albus TaxID=1888 RepID=UPI0036FCEB2F
MSWSGGLEIGNRQALIAVIAELRRDVGLSPDDCRALVDLYINRLAGKAPSKPYVWDFKWRRFQLLKALRETGLTVSTEEYESWSESTDTHDDASFIASWETS